MKYPQLVSMPSEISDWLEEQLEARGIDAVVYTRYVLSLLHRDPVDVVSPDQDLHFIQPNKGVRRSGSGRKHFRRFSGWRDHLQADAEKLTRMAAIECLMSASDQNCGIETLVDELCEKLKETKENVPVTTDSATTSNSLDPQTISPQDLAQKYYAAFPPLKKHRSSGTPTSIVTLIPKWFSSPKKKAARRQNRSASFEEKLHYKVDTDIMKPRICGKQKLGYFSRSRNDLGYSCSMAKSVERSESMADWDLLMFRNNNKSNFPVNSTSEFANVVVENVNNSVKQQRVLWSDEESMNICDDLPVDILDLLDSPGPRDYAVEMMNLANMSDVGNKNFIQCGTNITSSIWSVDAVIDDTAFDNTYNFAKDTDRSETLGIKFKSLTVGAKSIESIWSNPEIEENETNSMFESYRKSSLLDSIPFEFDTNSWEYISGLEKFEKWSEADYDNDNHLNNITRSLLKLNHNREESSFIEVIPKSGTHFSSKPSTLLPILTNKGNTNDVEKDDLLTSTRSHFKPINSTQDGNDIRNQRQYADGTSFVIYGNLEKPNYIRSASGSQYLATEKGSPRKLLEYTFTQGDVTKSDLVLKFFMKQNDKACQTDETIMDYEMDNSEVPCNKLVMNELEEEFFFPGDADEANMSKCTCLDNTNKECNDIIPCQIHSTQPDSMLEESLKSDTKKCDRCNKNTVSWANMEPAELTWQLDKESLESIWSGGEVCQTCIHLNKGRMPRNSQLYDDVSQDGEQLLSDLKSYYMELPPTEISYDLSELITGTKERKRRHSRLFERAKNAMPIHRGSWSIASLMKVTSVPVLHSVTL